MQCREARKNHGFGRHHNRPTLNLKSSVAFACPLGEAWDRIVESDSFKLQHTSVDTLSVGAVCPFEKIEIYNGHLTKTARHLFNFGNAWL